VIPIKDLLNRIRWDLEFARGEFQVGYYDHVEKRMISVPFKRIRFNKETPFSFQVLTADGEMIDIPFHRVREVFKDGLLIWQRPSDFK
jgi:uncharacterized protein (UPF0248 family)